MQTKISASPKDQTTRLMSDITESKNDTIPKDRASQRVSIVRKDTAVRKEEPEQAADMAWLAHQTDKEKWAKEKEKWTKEKETLLDEIERNSTYAEEK
jgi:hypothetical protein